MLTYMSASEGLSRRDGRLVPINLNITNQYLTKMITPNYPYKPLSDDNNDCELPVIEMGYIEYVPNRDAVETSNTLSIITDTLIVKEGVEILNKMKDYIDNFYIIDSIVHIKQDRNKPPKKTLIITLTADIECLIVLCSNVIIKGDYMASNIIIWHGAESPNIMILSKCFSLKLVKLTDDPEYMPTLHINKSSVCEIMCPFKPVSVSCPTLIRVPKCLVLLDHDITLEDIAILEFRLKMLILHLNMAINAFDKDSPIDFIEVYLSMVFNSRLNEKHLVPYLVSQFLYELMRSPYKAIVAFTETLLSYKAFCVADYCGSNDPNRRLTMFKILRRIIYMVIETKNWSNSSIIKRMITKNIMITGKCTD